MFANHNSIAGRVWSVELSNITREGVHERQSWHDSDASRNETKSSSVSITEVPRLAFMHTLECNIAIISRLALKLRESLKNNIFSMTDVVTTTTNAPRN